MKFSALFLSLLVVGAVGQKADVPKHQFDLMRSSIRSSVAYCGSHPKGTAWTYGGDYYPVWMSEDCDSFMSFQRLAARMVSKPPHLHLNGQTAKQPEPTEWPKVVSMQLVLDSVQAARQDHVVKPCAPENHDGSCMDPKLRHITDRIYASSKETCEAREGVPCTSTNGIQPGMWVPIGKPVFVDETPLETAKQEKPQPTIIKHIETTEFTGVSVAQPIDVPPIEVEYGNAGHNIWH